MKVNLTYVQTWFDDINGYMYNQYVVNDVMNSIINIPTEISKPRDGVIIFEDDESS